MEINDFAKRLESLAALEEPVRRKLYLYVADHGGDVSRDQAAQATGTTRSLAAFHLDRLVRVGLLDATFRRLSERTGPGAGRPSKLYRRSAAVLELSLPRRRYDLAAQVLAQALDGFRADGGREALRDAARAWGSRLAKDAGPPNGRPLERAVRALAACGFEPQPAAEGELVLRNCPFDALRAERRELVCGMNLALIEGMLEELDLPQVHARLAPGPGVCCVALRAGTPEP
jgi:predicted ArsR family transcriptional regulator